MLAPRQSESLETPHGVGGDTVRPQTSNWDVRLALRPWEFLCGLITEMEEGCGQDAHSWGTGACAKGPLMTGQKCSPEES